MDAARERVIHQIWKDDRLVKKLIVPISFNPDEVLSFENQYILTLLLKWI